MSATDAFHGKIQSCLDLFPPERWSAYDCTRVLEVLTDIAAAALRAEVDEVGR